jgi:hypothetical protein
MKRKYVSFRFYISAFQSVSLIISTLLPNLVFAKSQKITSSPEILFAKKFFTRFSKTKKLGDVMLPLLKFESPANQKAMSDFLVKNRNTALPKMSYKDNSIQFENGSESLKIDLISIVENRYRVNGYEFVYDRTKPFHERLKMFEKLVHHKKKFSLLPYVFVGDSAYGASLLIVMGLMLITSAGIAWKLNSNDQDKADGEIAVADSRRILFNFQLGLVCKDKNKGPTRDKLIVLTPDSSQQLAVEEFDSSTLYSRFNAAKVDMQSNEYAEINLENEKELKDYLSKIKSTYNLKVQFDDEKKADYLNAKKLVQHLGRCCENGKMAHCESRFNTNFFGTKAYETPEAAEIAYLNALESPNKGLLANYPGARRQNQSSSQTMSVNSTTGNQ